MQVIIKMTPLQWSQVRDNPIQRDTERRANKAASGHLSRPSPTHNIVHAARLPNGELVKLDGHTRSLLWSDGRLPSPESVQVVTYEANDIEEAEELYKQFDSPDATENASDRLSGAFRLHGIQPTSRLLLVGGITSALTLMDTARRSVYENVGEWRDELVLLDQIDAPPAVMPVPLIVAALMSIRKHGRRALDFWRLYCSGGGTRIDGQSCGVDELTRIVADLRARRQLAAGYNARLNQAGRALSCCDMWLDGRTYAGTAKPKDIRKYLQKTVSLDKAA